MIDVAATISSGVPTTCLASVSSVARPTARNEGAEAKADQKSFASAELRSSALAAAAPTIDSARFLSLSALLEITLLDSADLAARLQLLSYRQRGLIHVIDGVPALPLTSLPEIVAELSVSGRPLAAARLLVWVAENCAAGCGGSEVIEVARQTYPTTPATGRTAQAGWYAEWEEQNGR